MAEPLSLLVSSPSAEGLEHYAAHIGELLLWLRDEGLILSPMDQHLIEQWWEAGYPLDSVLETVHDRGLSLKRRKNPPRGLPLRSMKRWVVKRGERSRGLAVGAAEAGTPEPVAHRTPTLRATLLADLEEAVAERESEALLEALAELSQVDDAADDARLFSFLLGVGRRYYDRVWSQTPDPLRNELRDTVVQQLGGSAAAMDPAAFETTVEELCRRRLRQDDPLFDPDRYWSQP